MERAPPRLEFEDELEFTLDLVQAPDRHEQVDRLLESQPLPIQ